MVTPSAANPTTPPAARSVRSPSSSSPLFMSASQIPNLNTLRRGGGRGRPRGRGAAGAGPSSDGAAARDRVVQGTDNDASVSRLSAVELGYLDDPFARALTAAGPGTRRFPIINRGTYVRTTAIDNLVYRFLEPDGQPPRKKQIISLGAGSDTRVFRLLSSRPSLELVYHEIDFPVNTAAKIKAIRSTPLLQKTLRIEKQEDLTISPEGDALHTPSYHIHPIDLRTLPRPATSSDSSAPTEMSSPLTGVDTTLPTLLISECCLVYLSPTEAADVVTYFTRTLFPPSPAAPAPPPATPPTPIQASHSPATPPAPSSTPAPPATVPLGLILYEPIRPDDPFGRTMVSNLAARGIHLQTLHQYATLGAQRQRLREQGFDGGQGAADVDFIWERWVSEKEKERVAGLEMLDEVEEWKLLAQHYCVAWGWRDARGGEYDGVFDAWRDVEAQQGD